MTEDGFRRVWNVASDEAISSLVYRYPEKEYETWLGHFGCPIGISYGYPTELLDRVAAGLISYQMRMSLQTALKYAQRADRQKDPIPRFDRLFQTTSDLLDRKCNDFFTGDRPSVAGQYEGYIHAELFLWRTLSAFKASRVLINRGFLAEPAAVLRGALEQIAWCYAVSLGGKVSQLEHREPSNCIGQLRHFSPSAGRLYGLLSNLTHLDFDAQKHFVTMKDGYLGLTFQSTEFKLYGVLCHMLVARIYGQLVREIAKFYRRQFDLRVGPVPNFKLLFELLFDAGTRVFEGQSDEIVDRLIAARRA